MKLSQNKHKKSGPPVTKHMKQFGNRYDSRTKILTTQKGERLQKYAHGYFHLYKFNKKSVTPPLKKLLQSYPQWIILQNNLQAEEFQKCFQIMIEAHPKLLSIFQKQEKSQVSLLRQIDHIRFPYLKELQIHLQYGTNLESLGWFQAPLLQSIYILSKSIFSSANFLAKTNFPNLRIIKLEIDDQLITQRRNYDLSKVSRIRMQNIRGKQKDKFYIQNGSINLFRSDVSDLRVLAKMEIEKLPNFRLPQMSSKYNGKNISMIRIVEALNRKCNNKTTFYDLEANVLFNFANDIYGLDDSDSDHYDMDDYFDYDDSEDQTWGYGYWRSPYDFDDEDYYDD